MDTNSRILYSNLGFKSCHKLNGINKNQIQFQRGQLLIRNLLNSLVLSGKLNFSI